MAELAPPPPAEGLTANSNWYLGRLLTEIPLSTPFVSSYTSQGPNWGRMAAEPRSEGGLGRIIASAGEGAAFAILNFVMITYFDALSSLSISDGGSFSQILNQIALSWFIGYFLFAYLAPVFVAYFIMGGGAAGWGGVLVYTITWAAVASFLPLIGVGWVLHFLAVFILVIVVGFPYYLRNRGRRRAPPVGRR